MLTNPALRGRVRARAAATRTDSMLVSFCVYLLRSGERRMADTVTARRKVAVTRKFFKIKHLRFVSKMLTLLCF